MATKASRRRRAVTIRRRQRRIRPVDLEQRVRTLSLGGMIDRGPYPQPDELVRTDGPGRVLERGQDETMYRPCAQVRPGVYKVTKRFLRTEHARA